MYKNICNKFYWRELKNKKIYYNKIYKNIIFNHRLAISTLSKAMIKKNEIKKIKNIILKSLKIIPDKAIKYDPANAKMISILFYIQKKEKALDIICKMIERSDELLEYRIKTNKKFSYENQKQLIIINTIENELKKSKKKSISKEYQLIFHKYYKILINEIKNKKY